MECKIIVRNSSLSVADNALHQFLVLRIKHGKWEFPAVQMRFGESPLEACEREFAEVGSRSVFTGVVRRAAPFVWKRKLAGFMQETFHDR